MLVPWPLTLPLLPPEPFAPSWMFFVSWCVRWRCATSFPVCCHSWTLPLTRRPPAPAIKEPSAETRVEVCCSRLLNVSSIVPAVNTALLLTLKTRPRPVSNSQTGSVWNILRPETEMIKLNARCFATVCPQRFCALLAHIKRHPVCMLLSSGLLCNTSCFLTSAQPH